MKYISWHKLNEEQQKTAHEWWRSLSINQMKDFVKKHAPRFVGYDVVHLTDFEAVRSNILDVWDKEINSK